MVLELCPMIDDIERIDLGLAAMDKQVSGSQNPKNSEAEAISDERFALRDEAIAMLHQAMDALTEILDLDSQAAATEPR
ncbi:MAG: hypothetical protein ACRDZ4_13805 [Egibacteraceae bacterium]